MGSNSILHLYLHTLDITFHVRGRRADDNNNTYIYFNFVKVFGFEYFSSFLTSKNANETQEIFRNFCVASNCGEYNQAITDTEFASPTSIT